MNMTDFLLQIVQIAIPFLVFFAVASYIFRRTGGKDTTRKQQEEIRNEEKLNELFRRYFSVCDEPMRFPFTEGGRTHVIALEAQSEPVTAIDDVVVMLDDLKLNSFRNYVYYKQRFSGNVLLSLRDISQNEKTMQAYIDRIDEQYRKSEKAHTLLIKETIGRVAGFEEKVRDGDVRESLQILRNALTDLKNYDRRFGGDDQEVEKLCNRYMKILYGILDAFCRLEDADNPQEFAKVKARLKDILSLVTSAVRSVAGSLDNDEFIEIETEIEMLKKKMDLDRQAAAKQ